MTFTILPQELWPIAEAARTYFTQEWGARAFRDEQPVEKGSNLRPTLIGATSDHYHLCIEVSETAYRPTLDAFVLGCKNRALPVKLFVAMPAESQDSKHRENFRQAKANGVGVLEVNTETGQCIVTSNALALSLTGLRPVNAPGFPKRYRGALSAAYQTFIDGNPEKGCSAVYDEIEALTRRAAEKAHALHHLNGIPPRVNFQKHPWGPLMQLVETHLEVRAGLPTANLNGSFLARIRGTTDLRNSVSHKPRDAAALTKRDSQLRTRFESAVDLLSDAIEACKPLKLS